ncbi:MAG TPA: protein phosphatase 2C domain-containing protein, partial [Steroidobacteraceae bacterium]|nr:protein phosphatase 2C domain-containing protein [Steroidobacteraceae bacterium]
ETSAAPDASESAEALAEAAPPLGEEAPPWRYIIHEVPETEAERVEGVVKAGARATGLLAPVAFARVDGRAYVVGVELPGPNDDDEPARALGTAERLRPVDALTACSQLATALIAMRHAGLAHLHVSPDVVTLYDGRVYLSGVEDATPVTDPEEAKDLYARDANFLARTAGALGGATEVTLWERDSSAQRSLREINARGQAGGYTSADEVADAASLGLQVLMVGGATLGADVRAVRLRVDYGAYSSVGRVRSENQDAWGAALFDVRDDAAADAPLGVFLVADGMGGEAHGEIASRFVARVVTAEMSKRFLEPQSAWPALAIFTAAAEDATAAPQLPLSQALEQAVKEANRRTRAFGARLNATTGSTVTALAVAGARAALAHLGDSRAYMLREGQLLQLTEDHSLLARLEAIQHPMLEDPNFMVPRSVLYRSIGQEDDVTPDMLQFALAPGDRLMMCSDGLWDEVANDAIQRVMASASDPASCAEALVALANATGGHDNSTAIVLFVHAPVADAPFAGADLGQSSDAGEPGMSPASPAFMTPGEPSASGVSGVPDEPGAPHGEQIAWPDGEGRSRW